MGDVPPRILVGREECKGQHPYTNAESGLSRKTQSFRPQIHFHYVTYYAPIGAQGESDIEPYTPNIIHQDDNMSK